MSGKQFTTLSYLLAQNVMSNERRKELQPQGVSNLSKSYKQEAMERILRSTEGIKDKLDDTADDNRVKFNMKLVLNEILETGRRTLFPLDYLANKERRSMADKENREGNHSAIRSSDILKIARIQSDKWWGYTGWALCNVHGVPYGLDSLNRDCWILLQATR